MNLAAFNDFDSGLIAEHGSPSIATGGCRAGTVPLAVLVQHSGGQYGSQKVGSSNQCATRVRPGVT